MLTNQLLRIAGYAAAHSMAGDPERKGPEGWLPLYFDDYKSMDDDDLLSDEEVDDILADINSLNETQ